MVSDLRRRVTQMPVLPSSDVVRRRVAELQRELAKLNVLLRVASEMEAIDRDSKEGEESRDD